MKYVYIQINCEAFITVGEYVEVTDPKTYRKLKTIRVKKTTMDITNEVLTAGDVTGRDRYYETIMKERPKPGRGGLLKNEKESALYE